MALLAHHSQVAPPIAFLRRSLRVLNKFLTATDEQLRSKILSQRVSAKLKCSSLNIKYF